jgi:hypothetical protein
MPGQSLVFEFDELLRTDVPRASGTRNFRILDNRKKVPRKDDHPFLNRDSPFLNREMLDRLKWICYIEKKEKIKRKHI